MENEYKQRGQVEVRPALNFAFVRGEFMDKTEGGIIIPDVVPIKGDKGPKSVEPEGKRMLIVVESSRGYIDQGTFIETELQPGDRIWLMPGKAPVSHAGLPPEIAIVALPDVMTIERKVQTSH